MSDSLLKAVGQVFKSERELTNSQLVELRDSLSKELASRLGIVADASYELASKQARYVVDGADELLAELEAFQNAPAEIVAAPASSSPLVRPGAKSRLATELLAVILPGEHGSKSQHWSEVFT